MMFNLRFKYSMLRKLCSVFILLGLCLFSSCSDDEESVDDNGMKLLPGYIKFCYNGEVLELKDITSHYYLDGNVNPYDTIGFVYKGYADTKYYTSLNSVKLYIVNDTELDGVEFCYSEPGTNFGTVFRNYKMKGEYLYPLNTEIRDNGEIVYGTFNGTLFSGLDSMKIDSCMFHIEKFY